jgi:hypothetical protein
VKLRAGIKLSPLCLLTFLRFISSLVLSRSVFTVICSPVSVCQTSTFHNELNKSSTYVHISPSPPVVNSSIRSSVNFPPLSVQYGHTISAHSILYFLSLTTKYPFLPASLSFFALSSLVPLLSSQIIEFVVFSALTFSVSDHKSPPPNTILSNILRNTFFLILAKVKIKPPVATQYTKTNGTLRSSLLRDASRRTLVVSHRRFGTTYRLCLHRSNSPSLTHKDEIDRSF